MNWPELPVICPSRCEVCGKTGLLHECICAECLADLPALGAACSRCGIPTPEPVPVCGRCMVSPASADRTVTAFQYRYPLNALIKQLKYKQKIRLVTPLARRLANRVLSNTGLLPEVMVPVPLHYRRQYRRGYNQAIVICQALTEILGVPADPHLISRRRHTLPMFSLTASQRKRNIAGVFSLRGDCTYRSVAIVDDVITSGATVNELASVLRQAGVSRIEFWALARAD